MHYVLVSLPGTTHGAITPGTSMPTSPQQRPGLIQRIATSFDRDTLTTATLTTPHTTRRTSIAGRIHRRNSATNIGSSSDTNSRGPTPHPPTDAPPMQTLTDKLAILVNGNDDLVVTRELGATTRGYCVVEEPELEAYGCIHEEDACGSEEKGGGTEDPVFTVATLGVDPTGAFTRGEVAPGTWVCGEGGGVEEVAEEGGSEEGGGEAGGGFADLVHVELGEAGAQVQKGAHPGEDFAGEGGAVGGCDCDCGGGCSVGDATGTGETGSERRDWPCDCGVCEDGDEEGYVDDCFGRGHGWA